MLVHSRSQHVSLSLPPHPTPRLPSLLICCIGVKERGCLDKCLEITVSVLIMNLETKTQRGAALAQVPTLFLGLGKKFTIKLSA